MGIHDRDYYRDEETPQRAQMVRNIRKLSVTNKLLLANVVSYVVCWLVCYQSQARTEAVYSALSITNDYSQFWQVWRVLTYGFMHSPHWAEPGGIWHLLMNGFGLWMFGRFIEQRYGGAEFLRFYLLAIVFSGLVFVVTNLGSEPTRAVGASGGVVAIVILFCFLYPHEKLLIYGIIPVPAWVVGILYVGFDIVTGVRDMQGANAAIAWQAHLGGAAFATVYYLRHWNFGKWFSGFGKRKPKLSVYRDDTPQQVGAKTINDEPSAEAQLIEQGEEILQHLHEFGEDSLSSRQRKTLERYSELMQQRRGRGDDQYRI